MAVAPAASSRLLADVGDPGVGGGDDREPAIDRLAAVLGRDFAERLVSALSDEALGRLDAALTPAFAERLAQVLSEQRGQAAQ